MQNKNNKNNGVNVKSGRQVFCDNCNERVIFELQDKTHKFPLGLTTVLECLEFAIRKGALPKLPGSWVKLVEDDYNIEFDDKDVYFDS